MEQFKDLSNDLIESLEFLGFSTVHVKTWRARLLRDGTRTGFKDEIDYIHDIMHCIEEVSTITAQVGVLADRLIRDEN